MVIEVPTKPNEVPDLKQRDVRESVTKGRTKTEYYSISATAFHSIHPDIDDVTIATQYLRADADGILFETGINLPHGAVVTSVIVYGNEAAEAEEFYLVRNEKATGTQTNLSADTNINTKDTSIDNATIDNSNYTYGLVTTSLDTNDRIYGGIITYTIDTI